MKKMEFYVLNYNINLKKVEMYNIFQNSRLYKAIENEVKKYLKEKDKYVVESYISNKKKYTGYEAIKENIDRLIKWQMGSRRQYEISVADAFENDFMKFEKWDVYQQVHANIDLVTDMCVKTYENVQKKKTKDKNKIIDKKNKI